MPKGVGYGGRKPKNTSKAPVTRAVPLSGTKAKRPSAPQPGAELGSIKRRRVKDMNLRRPR